MPPSLIIKEATQVRPTSHGVRAMQLAAYINDDAKCVGHMDINMEAHDSRESMAREMAAICDAVDPTGKRKLMQHWILAWRVDAGETAPSAEDMYAAGREAMQGLGYGKCPYSMAIHGNTANPHVHIAVARVDQIEGTIVKDSWSHLKAQKAGAAIVARHGWQQSPGHLYTMQDGEIVVRKRRGKRGDIRTRTVTQEREKVEGKKTKNTELADILEEFCAETRERWSAWKWGDLHKALALKGVEMQYTQHGDAGGLAFSADGRHWAKASKVCPELSYGNIAKQLGASGTYRKARAGIAKIAADARGSRPALSCPAPQEAEQPQTQREERKAMTDAQLAYIAELALQRADNKTRKTLADMGKDATYTKAANTDFLRQNEDILQTLYSSKYSDADAYARLRHNAARYHLHLIALNAMRQRRSDEEKAQNRRRYAAFQRYAAQYANGRNTRNVAAMMMINAGAKTSNIAARLVDAMTDENEPDKNTMQIIGEQIGVVMDAMVIEILRDPRPLSQYEKLEAEIDRIEDFYASMSIHAPREYREGLEERKQEAIAAARALFHWRMDSARRREKQPEGQPQGQAQEIRQHMGDVVRDGGSRIRRRLRGIDVDDMPQETQELISTIISNIKTGRDNTGNYVTFAAHLAEIQTRKEVNPQAMPTAADATIYARHEARAAKTAPTEEKIKDMIALRLRTCGHGAGDAVRIMRAGMDIDAAIGAVARMYHSDHGDRMIEDAQKHEEQWRREERGEQQIRSNSGAGQAQTQRPAPTAGPRM